MEALSASLQPYKELVANVAAVITIGQFLSGILICKDIYKAGSAKGHSSVPFVGGLVLGLLMLFYGLIVNDTTMILVNLAAIGLNIAYTCCYYIYAEDKNDIMRPLSYGTAIVSVVYAYTKIEHPDNLEYRLGLLTTVALLSLIGSPLFEIGSIIKKRNAETMPMPIIISGTFCGLAWLLYGIIILNSFMIFQNLVGFALCITQILVYIFFRGGTKDELKEPKKKKAKKEH